MKQDGTRQLRRWTLIGSLALGACGGGGGDPEPASTQGRERPQAMAAPSQAFWGPKQELSLVPGAAANLPNGKVLLWSAQDRWSFSNAPGSTYTVVFDPVTGTRTERLANENDHNMFCPGTTNLPDGRLLVSGGSSSGATSIYDPTSNRWTSSAALNIPRAYQANTLLADGSVFTLGGSWNGGAGNKHAEVWTEGGGWRLLTGVKVDSFIGPDPGGVYRGDNHMWLIPTGHGRVLHAGPSARMNWVDTRGNGTVVAAGNRGDDPYAINGTTVMYDVGKVLKVGGAAAYENVDATNTAHLIDVSDGTARVRKLPSMAYARAFHNSVVLPNGQVLIVGGQTYPVPFSDNRSVLVPELWDPTTERFTPLAPMSSPRNYHSNALLLPDARVLSVGGGLCGMGCASNHPDLQILTPHYLLNDDGSPAVRPAILSAATVVNYGTTTTVTTDADVTSFALVRLSSTTHTVNNDQRRIPLTFTVAGTREYRLNVPSNPGVLVPGSYMLFAMNAQGVPSVSRTVRVSGSATPQLQAPADQLSTVNVASSVTLVASGSGTLSYAATGLPPGLSINAASGAITGTPTTAGTYQAVVSVSNASGRVSSQVRWVVQEAVPGALRFLRFEAMNEVYGHPWASIAEFNVLDRNGTAYSRVGWSVTASSEETTGEFSPVGSAFDGDPGSFWHTEWYQTTTGHPHTVTIDFGLALQVGGFRYLPRQVGSNGRVGNWRLHGSLDGVNWSMLTEGRFTDTATEQRVFPIGAAANRAPTLQTPANRSNRVGEAVSLQLSGSDPDGDALSYAASGLPPGTTIVASTGRISGTPTSAGTFRVALQVSDGRGGTASGSFDWTITSSVLTVAPVPVAPATRGSSVSYTASAQGSGLRYRWDFGDGSPTTAFSTSPSVNHVFAASGVYEVELTVTDSAGATRTQSFLQAVHNAVPSGNRPQHSASIGLQQPATGNARLWVVNPDGNSVGVFDAVTLTRLGEVTVGSAPRSAAVAPDGRLWVSNRDSSTISVVDLGTRSIVRTVVLPRASAPYGVVFAPNGSAAFVALEARGQVLRLNPSTGATLTTRSVGADPRHLSITRDSARLLVSRFVSPPMPGENTANVGTTSGGAQRGGEVVLLDAASLAIDRTIVLRHSDKADSTLQGRGIPNYLGAAVIAPDGSDAWVPSKQDNLRRGMLRDGLPLDFQNTVRAISSRINLSTLAEDYAARLDHDNAGLASAAAFHPTGAYLFVALETSRQVAVIDAYGRRELFRLEVGRAPQGLVVSADGRRLYVHNFMDRSVQVFDLGRLMDFGEMATPAPTTLATQGAERLSETVLRGKRLFYDARDPRLSRDAYISCASCHNDGGQDGRVWDFTGFGEGLRNTIPLRGRAGGQGRAHWSGNFDEIQDFEGQIRTLGQGSGLMSDGQFNTGTRSQPLGDRKTGLSTDLDALAAYVESLSRFDPSPFRNSDGSLTAAATAGKTVFERSCVSCHGGADFTSSASGTLRDIGTIKPSSGRRLGGTLSGIDVPTLRDVWASAPYLHDGSASTLQAAISAHNGVTLTATELTNVAAYVQQIGSEEPGLATGGGGGPARYVRLQALTEVNGGPWASVAEFDVLDASGNAYSRTGWVATVDSAELVGENAPARHTIDGDPDSFWHTQWQGANPAMPHTLTVDMGSSRTVRGFRYLPRQVGENGRIRNWRFYISANGSDWTLAGEGSFPNGATAQTVQLAASGTPPPVTPPTNRAPTLAALPARSDQIGQAVNVALVGQDADGDVLSYAATGLPPGVTVDAAGGRLTGSPTTAGSYAVTATVSDGRGGSASQGFTWTVTTAPSTRARYVRLEARSEVNGNPWAAVAEFNVLDANGTAVSRTGWTATVDSQELVGENAPARHAIDGDPNSIWHTQWQGANPVMPHMLTVDMGSERAVGGFRYLPRQVGENGRIREWRFHISSDGVNWRQLGTGSFPNSTAEQIVTFRQ